MNLWWPNICFSANQINQLQKTPIGNFSALTWCPCKALNLFSSHYRALQKSKAETKIYKKLANMAGSAGQLSRPSGMGGYWSYSGWLIFSNGNNWEGMTIFRRNDTNPEGMTIIRKEWQKSGRNDSNTEGMTITRKEWHKVIFWKKIFFGSNLSPIRFITSVRS